MRLTGTITELDIDQFEECDYEVKEAVVTDGRVAIDWTEDGQRFHLLAESTDGGTTYQGHFGFDRPNANWIIELTRYTAVDGDVLLLAKWHQKDTGDQGACFFELSPEDE